MSPGGLWISTELRRRLSRPVAVGMETIDAQVKIASYGSVKQYNYLGDRREKKTVVVVVTEKLTTDRKLAIKTLHKQIVC